MSKKDVVARGINVAEKYGFTIPSKLAKEIESFDNPQYRIAVAGKFQVGKSTLINKVFLSDNPILIEGEGLCTTSVNTELEYAPVRGLEVFRWSDADKLSETSFKKIENPTSEDLKSVTVGNDRIALAQSVSKVKLYEPNESLKNYTIIDTPGIDDPDPEILQNTTFRVIPGSDLAIIVVEPRQLDQTELNLIRTSMIRQGVSKLMVLASYKPEISMNESQRKAIVETIKAQLTSCGKGDIPVEMYCFNDSIDDILCTAGEISMTISSFLANNAVAGREERVAAHVKDFLNDCLVDISARIKTAAISQEEKEQLQKRFESKKVEIKEKCQLLINRLNSEIAGIKKGCQEKVKLVVSKTFDDYVSLLENAKEIEEIKKIISNADGTLKWQLAEGISQIAEDIEEKVRCTFENHLNDFKDIGSLWDVFVQDEFHVDGGFVTKIPNLVWEILNIITLDVLLPGGIILAFLGRLLQRLLPILKDLTLQNLVKMILVKKIKNTFEKSEAETIQNINEQICANLDEVMGKAKEFILSKYDESSKAVADGLYAAPAEDAALKNAQAEIQAVINAL